MVTSQYFQHYLCPLTSWKKLVLVFWIFTVCNLRRQLDWNLLAGKSTCVRVVCSIRHRGFNFRYMSLIQFGGNVTEDAWFKVGVSEYSYLTSWARTVQFRVCVTRQRPCHVCVSFHLAETGVYLRGMRLGQRTRHQPPIIALLRAVIVVHNVSLTAVSIRPVRDWLLENVADNGFTVSRDAKQDLRRCLEQM